MSELPRVVRVRTAKQPDGSFGDEGLFRVTAYFSGPVYVLINPEGKHMTRSVDHCHEVPIHEEVEFWKSLYLSLKGEIEGFFLTPAAYEERLKEAPPSVSLGVQSKPFVWEK